MAIKPAISGVDVGIDIATNNNYLILQGMQFGNNPQVSLVNCNTLRVGKVTSFLNPQGANVLRVQLLNTDTPGVSGGSEIISVTITDPLTSQTSLPMAYQVTFFTSV